MATQPRVEMIRQFHRTGKRVQPGSAGPGDAVRLSWADSAGAHDLSYQIPHDRECFSITVYSCSCGSEHEICVIHHELLAACQTRFLAWHRTT